MRKRILSLICSAAVVVSMLPTGYVIAKEKYDSEEAEKCLTELGIYSGSLNGRDAFVYGLAGFAFDDAKAVGDAEDVAKRIGTIASDEVYTENTSITVLEAYEYAVKVLGYQNQAVSFGGYKKIASELGLTDGITANDSSKLSKEDAKRILFNMLEVEPSVYTFDGVEPAEEETLLSLKRSIYKTQGVLEADSVTSVIGEDLAADGYVTIDGEAFEYDGNARGLLGKTVVVYSHREKPGDTGEIIYIGEKTGKNNTLIVAGEDVENVSDDFTSLEYEKNGKTAKVKIPRSIDVVYNGKYYGAYTKEDFMPEEGTLEFVDCDNDGAYETVFITAYSAVVVESVNTGDKVITGKYGCDGCIKEILLEEKQNDVAYKIYKGDKEIKLGEISANDILSVAASKSEGDKYYEIYVSENEPVKAKLDGNDTYDRVLTYNNTEHDMARELVLYMSFTGKTLQLGKGYKFFTDKFGKVVYYETVADNDYRVVRKFYQDESDESLYYGVYMNMEEEWKTAKFAKKIKYNGTTISNDIAFEHVKDIKGELVKIKENSAGEIKCIDVAEADVIRESAFTKTSEASYNYRLQAYTLDYNYYIEEDAYLVYIPTDVSDTDGYKVYNARGFFAADKNYQKVSVYDSDEYGFTSMLTIKETSSLKDLRVSKSLFVVRDKVQKVVDDEIYSGVEGSAGALQNFTLIGKDDSVFADVQKGDVINVYVNDQGKTESAKVVFNLNNFKNQALSNMFSVGIIAGTIEKIDISKNRMIINCGYSQRMKISPTTLVSDYTEGKGVTDVPKATSLRAGDKVVLYSDYGVIKEIIRVK